MIPRISEIITEQGILICPKCPTKSRAIELLVESLCQGYEEDLKKRILEAVNEKEKEMSTGIGCGLAIPHAKVKGIDNIQVTAMNLKVGIDFNATDREPVFLIFLIASPEHLVGPHIRAMSSICRLASDADLRKRLIEARSAKEFLRQLKLGEKKYPQAT
jgi:mannitol/fructose-specific phosphotransferase system IIA component (Ntr-type)